MKQQLSIKQTGKAVCGMTFTLLENSLTAGSYNLLRSSAGWPAISPELAKTSLPNSWYAVAAIYEDMVIGIARTAGDGGLLHFIQSVIVNPSFQGKGTGKAMVEKRLKIRRRFHRMLLFR